MPSRTRPLSDIPDDLIAYLRKTHPPENLKRNSDGSWENPLDAAMRRGQQELIDYIQFLHNIQHDPSLTKGTPLEGKTLEVDIDENGNLELPVDGYVLRTSR
jgi:hypothetical protein